MHVLLEVLFATTGMALLACVLAVAYVVKFWAPAVFQKIASHPQVCTVFFRAREDAGLPRFPRRDVSESAPPSAEGDATAGAKRRIRRINE